MKGSGIFNDKKSQATVADPQLWRQDMKVRKFKIKSNFQQSRIEDEYVNGSSDHNNGGTD